MKVLYLLKSNSYSGAENVILTLMSQLPKDYEAYYVSPDGPIRDIVRSRGQRFVALNKPDLKSVRNVIKLINPDVIHASDFSMSLLAALTLTNIPIISHLHNNPTWIKKSFDLRKIAYRLALRRFSKVACVSSTIVDEFNSKSLTKKAVVIPNIVDISKVRELAADRQVFESDICLVGRLTLQKNPLFFCKVIKKIKDSVPNIKALIIGRGELKDKVENYIHQNDLTNNIKLIGFEKNPYPYMKNTKVCIMPSSFEGFGLVAVEMLALGKPVIASNVGGLKNIINNKCGVLIDGYNVEDYANNYFKLITRDTYKKKVRGALFAAARYSDAELFKNSFIRVYTEAIKCRN